MAKPLNYTQKVEALIKGTDAKTIAESNQRQLTTGINVQLSVNEATKLDREEAVEAARQEVEASLLNDGELIVAGGREVVLDRYYKAKAKLEQAELDLANQAKTAEWLQEALELIK